MRIITPRVHGYFDLMIVAAFAVAPSLYGFSSPTAKISYSIAAIHLIVSLITAYRFGILKLIPFPVHGALDFIVAVGLVGLPWIAGFAPEMIARNFYIAAGAVVFLVVLLTDYRASAASLRLTVSRAAR